MFGILLVRKPLGITSHDVVNHLRRTFNTKRVGHAGTLDPMAEGVLVVAVGPATRFLQYLPLEPKEYRAQVAFGRTTTSYDQEGDEVETKPVPADLGGRIAEAIPRFMGLIDQFPPMFSAVKVNGKPLYHYARQGKELKRESRTVHIGKLDVVEFEGHVATMEVECSGGTYIRSLAHDLGQEVGCGAYLSGLVRTRVGRFSLDAAIPMADVTIADIIPLREALPPMPLVELSPLQTEHVRDGRPVILANPPSETVVALLDTEGNVFSIARRHGNVLQPECVIPAEAGIV